MPDKYGRMTQEEKAQAKTKLDNSQRERQFKVAQSKNGGGPKAPEKTHLPSAGDALNSPAGAVRQGVKHFQEESATEASKQADDKAAWDKAKAENKARHEANKGVDSKYSKNPDLLANPEDAAKAAQNGNALEKTDEQWRAMGEDPKDHPQQAYDPGDTDGDGIQVSKETGNDKPGDPIKPKIGSDDPFKDTKAAWKHLTDVFGDKVSALQAELENRLGEQLTPTERETGNPFAGDDVPESKEMSLDDVKQVAENTKNDATAVLKGAGDVGSAALDLGGAAAKDTGNAIVDGMGIDRKAVTDTGRTLAGLSGLFSSDDSGNSKVPDSNWKPKSINELFRGN